MSIERSNEEERRFFNGIGMLTSEQKAEHHTSHKIPLPEAIYKPEFWVVNAITLTRLVAGLYAMYLTYEALQSTQSPGLALPVLLNSLSWTADYFDGKLARKWKVCTDEGGVFDKVFTDGIMSINTLAIPIVYACINH